MAGDDIDLPEELAKMVDEDEEEEETNDSFLKKLQNVDVDTLKTKAQATVTEIKQTAEDKCTLMWPSFNKIFCTRIMLRSSKSNGRPFKFSVYV